MSQGFHGDLTLYSYVSQRTHRYLSEDAWRIEGPNIGSMGEHLTITFLNVDQCGLSERLCSSIAREIPHFAGEVLIVDNGSRDQERNKLSLISTKMPFRSRLVELGQNFGVAGGRNRTMPHVRTPWVMILDNSVFFVKNPLPAVQKDLGQLGCNFLTLAVLNEDGKTNSIRGGHLWLNLEQGELVVGGGTAKRVDDESEDGPGYLGTFLSGCASVFRVDSFLAQGGFDEGMFLGLEDTEFSLRLFRAGLKVGASDTRALVYAHPDLDRTNGRSQLGRCFARERFEKAARHFQQKHGFRISPRFEEKPVAERHRELRPDKHRLALVADVNNWALANIASQIERYLGDEFEFEVFTSADVDRPDILAYLTREHSLTHYFWREPLHQLRNEWTLSRINKYFGSWAAFQHEVLAHPRTLSVYDHLWLLPREAQDRLELFRNLIVGYTVSSKRLERIYSNLPAYPAPNAVTQDGVDLGIFHPVNLERLKEVGKRPLRVGWVGNSGWASEIMEDPKGLHSILAPAVAALNADGAAIELRLADRRAGFIPHLRMPEYYSTIDVLVCTSLVEGTPNPVLEAMACGVPVISTDVGIVPEAFGPVQRRLILPKRSVEALCAAIRLYAMSGMAEGLSAENLASIREWDWSNRVETFRSFFRRMLRRSQCDIGAQSGSLGAALEPIGSHAPCDHNHPCLDLRHQTSK